MRLREICPVTFRDKFFNNPCWRNQKTGDATYERPVRNKAVTSPQRRMTMKIDKWNKTMTKTVRTLTAFFTFALAFGASPALLAQGEAIKIKQCGPVTQSG